MPRHYTDAEKRLVLDRLIANHGDVPRTAAECGVNERNIYVWRKDSKFADMELLNLKNPTNFPNQLPSPVATGEGLGLGVSSLPPDTAEAFQTLHDKLLSIAETLANRIVEAIDEAPLNQRMTALSQLIDRIAKLAALLPESDDEPEPSGKPFEIDYDVEEKDDEDEQEEDQECRSLARPTSESEEDSPKHRPF